MAEADGLETLTNGSASNDTNSNNDASKRGNAPSVVDEAGENDAKSDGVEAELGPEYEKFKAMLKVGVPEGAVRTKMEQSGLDADKLFLGREMGQAILDRRRKQDHRLRQPEQTSAPPMMGGKMPLPPMPPAKKPMKKVPSAPSGGRGNLLAAIQKGTMLKKTKTVEKGLNLGGSNDNGSDSDGGNSGGGGGGMMAEILAKARAKKKRQQEANQ